VHRSSSRNAGRISLVTGGPLFFRKVVDEVRDPHLLLKREARELPASGIRVGNLQVGLRDGDEGGTVSENRVQSVVLPGRRFRALMSSKSPTPRIRAFSPRAAQRVPGAQSQHELHMIDILMENRDYEVSLAPSGLPIALKKAKHSC
jgi:hypothetical protein